MDDELEDLVKKLNGDALYTARKQQRLSREEVAYRADMHVNSVGLYERGEKDMTTYQLLKLAKVLSFDKVDTILEQSKKEISPAIQKRIDESSSD